MPSRKTTASPSLWHSAARHPEHGEALSLVRLLVAATGAAAAAVAAAVDVVVVVVVAAVVVGVVVIVVVVHSTASSRQDCNWYVCADCHGKKGEKQWQCMLQAGTLRPSPTSISAARITQSSFLLHGCRTCCRWTYGREWRYTAIGLTPLGARKPGGAQSSLPRPVSQVDHLRLFAEAEDDMDLVPRLTVSVQV